MRSPQLIAANGRPVTGIETPVCSRILVADDDPGIQILCRLVLENAGLDVDLVSDGDAAWQALQAGSYDVLLTDNRMPRMNGLELIRALGNSHMELPVILMSGDTDAEERMACGGAISAFLPKPFTAHQLLDVVEEVCAACAVPGGGRGRH